MTGLPNSSWLEPTPIDEEALVVGLRAGDDAAYELMVRAFGGRLLAVAKRILRSEEDARDAVQTAYLLAFRSLHRFEGGSRLSTWLHRIVVNAALMRLRSRRRRPEESIEPLLPVYLDDGHHARRYCEDDLPADALIEREETRAAVRACIDQLPERHRMVLLLRDIEDMSNGEVAAMLGISTNAVKIRLHRARQALGELLRRSFAETARATPTSKPRADRPAGHDAARDTSAAVVDLGAPRIPPSSPARAVGAGGHIR